MRILITAGGTREPIDDVRYVGNVSSGRTGALIAEEAVRRFHTVHHLAGTGAVPTSRWAQETGLVVPQTFSSTAHLMELAQQLLTTRQVDAVVAAAAVADFTPDFRPGKISSGRDELVVRMKPTPKVLDAMRQWAPEALLVAFKLESGIPAEELAARARSTMTRARADAIVANDLAGIGSEEHPATILLKDGQSRPVARRAELAGRLIDLLEELHNG